VNPIAAADVATRPSTQPPRVLVLTGGLVHLVHQLAVAVELPGLGNPPAIGVLITGVLTRDPEGLARLQAGMEGWFERIRRQAPQAFAGLRLLPDAAALAPGDWDVVCLNNAWQGAQRQLVERLAIHHVVVCGDGLGVYYRSARELRALLPSLLARPIRWPGKQVRYVLGSARQPCWHRPPELATAPSRLCRGDLFEQLVQSLRQEATPLLAACREAAGSPAGGRGATDRPIWLCSVPNLAHQFPGGRIPPGVLREWQQRLVGFDPRQDRLLLIDHPKAPAAGSFGPPGERWIAGPLRTPVPLEVLVRLLERECPGRPVVVAGLTSALYGVRQLTGAAVVWLPLAPLWRWNPGYRSRPLEFLHRWLRARRMALLTGT
jgi:hypothetical protein